MTDNYSDYPLSFLFCFWFCCFCLLLYCELLKTFFKYSKKVKKYIHVLTISIKTLDIWNVKAGSIALPILFPLLMFWIWLLSFLIKPLKFYFVCKYSEAINTITYKWYHNVCLLNSMSFLHSTLGFWDESNLIHQPHMATKHLKCS